MQIVDFLNANPIKYALTINPTIYTLCIENFWATVKVITVNGEVQLQALVDGKKIIIIESTVRRDLQLEDVKGVDCLPNATFFEQLALMSSKTTAWNEFSSTMASVIICLAIDQKFNFLKFIFESMVKNSDNVGKFLMYLRFRQVFLDKQLERVSNHNRIYVTPSHTKKIFGNMRRVEKGFSRRETPLFQTMVVQDQAEMGEGSTNPTDPHHIHTIIQPQKKQKPRKPKRKDTQIPQSSGPTEHVADEAVYKELDNSLVRAATTASNLEAEQDSGNIIKTRSKDIPNEVGSQGTTSGGGPKHQETMGDTISQTRFENVSKLSNDLLRARVNTLRRGKDSLKLNELMELCTNLQQRVIDLETTKTTQANKIASLKRRVKKLEQKKRSRTYGLKRLYKVGLIARVESSGDEERLGEDASKQGRINAIDVDEDLTLVNDQDNADMFDVNTLTGDEVLAKPEVAVKDVNLTVDEVSAATTTTTAIILNPRKGIVITKLGTSTTTTTISSQPSQAKVQDKGKGIMVEEPVKSMKKKDLVRLDEEIASKLQARFDEEERLTREKDEANVPLTEEWDDIQAKVKADYQLAQELQAQEQEELTDEEKARLFVQFLEQRRKHFASKRAEEKRNRPSTRAQQRNIITELVEESSKKVEIEMEENLKKAEAEVMEGSSKRAGTKLEQEVTKKQKVDDV
ncbi:hypothetical protein Tco_1348216 [Tanacetum coccineum]